MKLFYNAFWSGYFVWYVGQFTSHSLQSLIEGRIALKGLDSVAHTRIQCLFNLDALSVRRIVSIAWQMKRDALKNWSSPKWFELTFFGNCFSIRSNWMIIEFHVQCSMGSRIRRELISFRLITAIGNVRCGRNNEWIFKFIHDIFAAPVTTPHASALNGIKSVNTAR